MIKQKSRCRGDHDPNSDILACLYRPQKLQAFAGRVITRAQPGSE
jgi:hypothetical protein